jgi:hypothetical protein
MKLNILLYEHNRAHRVENMQNILSAAAQANKGGGKKITSVECTALLPNNSTDVISWETTSSHSSSTFSNSKNTILFCRPSPSLSNVSSLIIPTIVSWRNALPILNKGPISIYSEYCRTTSIEMLSSMASQVRKETGTLGCTVPKGVNFYVPSNGNLPSVSKIRKAVNTFNMNHILTPRFESDFVIVKANQSGSSQGVRAVMHRDCDNDPDKMCEMIRSFAKDLRPPSGQEFVFTLQENVVDEHNLDGPNYRLEYIASKSHKDDVECFPYMIPVNMKLEKSGSIDSACPCALSISTKKTCSLKKSLNSVEPIMGQDIEKVIGVRAKAFLRTIRGYFERHQVDVAAIEFRMSGNTNKVPKVFDINLNTNWNFQVEKNAGFPCSSRFLELAMQSIRTFHRSKS